jgi:hypothetical protein
MELLLNAVWVAIWGTALALLFQSSGCGFDRKRFLRVGALLCAAVVLFPFISASDDIYSEPFIVEDSRSGKHVTGAKVPGGVVVLLWLASASLLLLFDLRRRQTVLSVNPTNPFLHASPLLKDLLGRAPPLALYLRATGIWRQSKLQSFPSARPFSHSAQAGCGLELNAEFTMSAFFRVLAQSQPIDLAILGIEVLLLLVLAYQQFTRIVHKRRLNKQLSKLFYALAEGQELQAIAPDTIDENSVNLGKWKRAVRNWMDVTRTILEGCSGNAVISFAHDPVLTLTHAGRMSARSEYESLIARLNNLRCIMEHIDAYFPR